MLSIGIHHAYVDSKIHTITYNTLQNKINCPSNCNRFIIFDIFIRFIIFNTLDLYINKLFILIHNLKISNAI